MRPGKIEVWDGIILVNGSWLDKALLWFGTYLGSFSRTVY